MGDNHTIEEIVSMLDDMASSGVSRIKIDTSDEMKEGTKRKQYHHGRCDVGSPFACGTPFDVLEEKSENK